MLNTFIHVLQRFCSRASSHLLLKAWEYWSLQNLCNTCTSKSVERYVFLIWNMCTRVPYMEYVYTCTVVCFTTYVYEHFPYIIVMFNTIFSSCVVKDSTNSIIVFMVMHAWRYKACVYLYTDNYTVNSVGTNVYSLQSLGLFSLCLIHYNLEIIASNQSKYACNLDWKL